VAGGKRTAAELGAWLVVEDESGQGLRPPKGRTWGRRGTIPVVRVTGGSNKRVSLAGLIAVRPGQRPRLIYRVHRASRRGDKRKGFTDVSRTMTDLIAARDRLTVYQLPPYASELNPAESVWSVLKRDPWPTWSNVTSASSRRW
jgi:putative transposase